MSKIGIIAEFNPLHNGHEYLINQAKRENNSVICALSGNFVQRGDVAVFSKEDRIKAALNAGADIVVEIPSVYSMSTAQNFALAGVWQLYNIGCDRIVFGSECGDVNTLTKTADVLLSDEYAFELAKLIKSGETFAVSREKAAAICGADTGVFKNPNDNLGIEYISAAKRLRLNISFDTVKRIGAMHDAAKTDSSFASGSFLREQIKSGNFKTAKKYIPFYTHSLLTPENVASITHIDRTVLGILRQKTKEELSSLPDLSEGIENRLFEAVKTAKSLNELCEAVKTKRYTLSRIRRLVLSAALGFDNSFFMVIPPYTRVLGAGENGLSLLKNTVSLTPVITKPSEIEKLDAVSNKLYSYECRATDLYALCFNTPRPCGKEYTLKFLKKQ